MSDVTFSSVKRGSGATKSLHNAFTTAGYNAVGGIAANALASNSASGALTANTLVDLINESAGAGLISQLSIFTVDTTSRTLRIVVTVDGTVIYDKTSAAITSSGAGAVLAGSFNSTSSFSLPYIKYDSSIRVQYASNQNETGKFTTSLARTQVA